MATLGFLESCATRGVGICFVEERWVAFAGTATQSHLDDVMLRSACRVLR